MNGDISIRLLDVDDQSEWASLWLANCAVQVPHMRPSEVLAVWSRLFDPESSLLCLVAVAAQHGSLLGIAHCVVHEQTLSDRPACMLEHLFVDPGERGRGVARALIAELRRTMSGFDWDYVHWASAASNSQALAAFRFAADDSEEAIRFAVWGEGGGAG